MLATYRDFATVAELSITSSLRSLFAAPPNITAGALTNYIYFLPAPSPSRFCIIILNFWQSENNHFYI